MNSLKTNPDKVRAWQQRSRKRIATKSPLKRGGCIKPRFSKKASVNGDDARTVRDDCDQLVREILKLRDSRCITCPTTEGLQVGHLLKRGKHRVRWDLLNCHAQCPFCNRRHNDEPEHYVEVFQRLYGEQTYLELQNESRNGAVLTYVELLAIRDGLRRELARLKGSDCLL